MAPVRVATTDRKEHFGNVAQGVGHQYQRGVFHAEGRFWLFYSTGGNIYYVTSTDGVTWSSPTLFKEIGAASEIAQLDVHVDGDQIHTALGGMATPPATSSIYYRRGTLNGDDGTITWGSEQTVQTAEGSLLEVGIATDSDGVPWITYEHFADESNPYPKPYVTRATDASGTWSTETGYPMELSSTRSHWWTSIARLNESGAMIAFYWHDLLDMVGTGQPTMFARVWNGSTWESEIVIDENVPRGDLDGGGRNFSAACVTDPATERAWFVWSDQFGNGDHTWFYEEGSHSVLEWSGIYSETLALGFDVDEGEPFLVAGSNQNWPDPGPKLHRWDGTGWFGGTVELDDKPVFGGALQATAGGDGGLMVVYQGETEDEADPLWTVALVAPGPDRVDDFEVEDQEPLPAPWGAPWHDIAPFRVIEGAAYPNSDEFGSQRWEGQQFGPDCWVLGMLKRPIPRDTSFEISRTIGARITGAGYGEDYDSDSNGYGLDATIEANNEWRFNIWRVQPGDTFDLLDEVTNDEAAELGGLRLECQGSSIRGYALLDGVWTRVCEATDENLTGAGYIGIGSAFDTAVAWGPSTYPYGFDEIRAGALPPAEAYTDIDLDLDFAILEADEDSQESDDTGTLTDTAATSAAAAGTDTAALTDAATPGAAAAATETGALTDTANVSTSEPGAGTDVDLDLDFAILPGQETAEGDDTATLSEDAQVSTDEIQPGETDVDLDLDFAILPEASDEPTSADSGTLLEESLVTVDQGDVEGTLTEQATVEITRDADAEDDAEVTEQAQVTQIVGPAATDQAQAAEQAATAAELDSGGDAAQLSEQAALSTDSDKASIDSAAVTDAASAAAQQAVLDAFGLTEAAEVDVAGHSPTVTDAGALTETAQIEVAATAADQAHGTDATDRDPGSNEASADQVQLTEAGETEPTPPVLLEPLVFANPPS